MTEREKSCHDCWQYCNYCESCKKGWCDWYTSTKRPFCAEECKAYNPKREERKHRDEDGEIFPLVEGFYDFLQGNSVPGTFWIGSKPNLTPEQAFSVIYILQQHLHVLPESFEKCDGCDRLFNSDCEGAILDGEPECDGKTLPEKYWGFWCADCLAKFDWEVER